MLNVREGARDTQETIATRSRTRGRTRSSIRSGTRSKIRSGTTNRKNHDGELRDGDGRKGLKRGSI